MATVQPIRNRDARFCRDCGGPLTIVFDDYKICKNTTTVGEQKDPKDLCESLGREGRLFCEFSGTRVAPGETVCPNCKRKASNP